MTRDFIVGVLFLLAIFILGAITILVRGVPFGGEEYNLEVHFEDVAGLSTGDTVRIRGYKSGEVTSIRLDRDSDSVIVNLRLYVEEVPRGGYEFQVQPVSPLGGSFVSYNYGEGDPVPASEILIGNSGGDLFSTVSALLKENQGQLTEGLRNLSELLHKMNTGRGLVGGIFNDNAIRDNFAKTFKELSDFGEELVKGEGLAGALFTDAELKTRFENIVEKLDSQLDKIEAGKGTVGMVLNDVDFQEKVDGIVTRIEKISESVEQQKGLVGRLIHGEDLAHKIDDTVTLVNEFANRVTTGEGILGKLTYDDDLADQFSNTVSWSGNIAKRIKEGPGSLHNVIFKTDLYEEARDTLTLVRDSTEDVREQEPISAFFSILFAPF